MCSWSPPTATATTPHGRTMWQNWQKSCSAPLTGAATWWCLALPWDARRRCCIFAGNQGKRLVKGHGNFPVYIDSPLATEATRIFRDTDPDCFDTQTRALLEKGIDPINVPGLRISVTSDDSRMINTDRTPKVILSASGMCEAGRIRHHLKHNLWRPECTILFVGFQAVGTLGRTLIEGVDSVKLFGEPIEVKAEICQLTGMSGHADKDGLLRWVNAFTEKPRRVFVIHGEDEVENRFVDT